LVQEWHIQCYTLHVDLHISIYLYSKQTPNSRTGGPHAEVLGIGRQDLGVGVGESIADETSSPGHAGSECQIIDLPSGIRRLPGLSCLAGDEGQLALVRFWPSGREIRQRSLGKEGGQYAHRPEACR